jgi:hypothetical protein
MKNQGFSDVSIATSMRDAIKAIAEAAVSRIHPPCRYGEVVGLQESSYVCQVLFPGSNIPVSVNMGSVQPSSIGQKVRVSPQSGDFFLEDVIGPANIITIEQ